MDLAGSFDALESQTADWDEAEVPATVTISGEDYACAADVGRVMPEWDDKTMTTRQVQMATVRIRRTLLATCPSTSVRVKLSGLEWFVTGLGEQSPTSKVWQLQLKRVITKALP